MGGYAQNLDDFATPPFVEDPRAPRRRLVNMIAPRWSLLNEIRGAGAGGAGLSSRAAPDPIVEPTQPGRNRLLGAIRMAHPPARQEAGGALQEPPELSGPLPISGGPGGAGLGPGYKSAHEPIAPRGTSPRLAELIGQQAKMDQPEPQPSFKSRLLRSLATMAPMAIAGIAGSPETAQAVGKSTEGYLAEQDKARSLRDAVKEQRRQENLREQEAERGRIAGAESQERLFAQQSELEGKREEAAARRAAIQADKDRKPDTLQMGDKMYQYNHGTGKWDEIGLAKESDRQSSLTETTGWYNAFKQQYGREPTTQEWNAHHLALQRQPPEPGNYVPQVDPNDPNRTIGAVDWKSKRFVSTKDVPGLEEAAGGGRPGVAAKVTGQSKSRADAGAAVVPLLNSVRKQLEDPEVRAGIGPLAGRWSDLEKRAGNLPPKLRRLAGTLTSIYSLGGTMHGWRALQVAQEFEKQYGGLPTTPEGLLASMDALDETARSVMGAGGYGGGGQGAVGAGAGTTGQPQMKWYRNKKTGEMKQMPARQ